MFQLGLKNFYPHRHTLSAILLKLSTLLKLLKFKQLKLLKLWKGYDSSFNRWLDKKDIVI